MRTLLRNYILFHLSILFRVCYGSVDSCCIYESDALELFNCVKLRSNASPTTSGTVAILSFATSETLQYSSYALAINKSYADRRGYVFILFEDWDRDEDPRWIKILLLRNALQEWAKNFTYIVWMDSDLAIINHSLVIEHFGANNPNAHIFMSRDVATAPFVSNSGLIIVRNSAWSADFLNLWWLSYDRSKCCDQNAFTWLYDRKLPIDIQERTALLPANAINSDFPAWRNQKSSDPVLHLAGLSSLYRSVVFHAGFKALCAAESKQMPLPDQLGLSRDYLFDVMLHMDAARAGICSSLIREIDSIPANASNTASTARTIRHRLEDALKVDDDERNHATLRDLSLVTSIQQDAVVLRQWVVDSLLHHARNHYVTARTQEDSRRRLIAHEEIREAIGSAFELYIAMNSARTMPVESAYLSATTESNDLEWPEKGSQLHHAQSTRIILILEECLSLIDTVLLEPHLSITVKGSFLYHRFKAFQLLAEAYQRNVSHSITLLTSAVDSWRRMMEANHFASLYVLADPDKEYTTVLSELALLHCLQGRHLFGVEIFLESLDLQQRMLTGYSNIKIASTDIIWLATITLSNTAINAAVCCVHSPCLEDVPTTSAISKTLSQLLLNTLFKEREPEKYNTVEHHFGKLRRRISVKKLKKKTKKNDSN